MVVVNKLLSVFQSYGCRGSRKILSVRQQIWPWKFIPYLPFVVNDDGHCTNRDESDNSHRKSDQNVIQAIWVCAGKDGDDSIDGAYLGPFNI